MPPHLCLTDVYARGAKVNRPTMTRTARSNSTTFIPILLYSRREAWKIEALAITMTSPEAAATVNHVAIPVMAGRMSPIAPSISATPINQQMFAASAVGLFPEEHGRLVDTTKGICNGDRTVEARMHQ